MTLSACPCHSGKAFQACCATILDGAPAATAEALMRSRYTACALKRVDHLLATAHPRTAQTYDPEELTAWLAPKTWLELAIQAVRKGGAQDKLGRVHFRALYEEAGAHFWHEELSRFEKLRGTWFYVDGQHPQK